MPPKQMTPNTVGTMNAYFSGGNSERMGLPKRVSEMRECEREQKRKREGSC